MSFQGAFSLLPTEVSPAPSSQSWSLLSEGGQSGARWRSIVLRLVFCLGAAHRIEVKADMSVCQGESSWSWHLAKCCTQWSVPNESGWVRARGCLSGWCAFLPSLQRERKGPSQALAVRKACWLPGLLQSMGCLYPSLTPCLRRKRFFCTPPVASFVICWGLNRCAFVSHLVGNCGLNE